MSEATDSPVIFEDSITVEESVEVAVADVTDEIETIEIDDSADVDDSSVAAKKKSKKSNISTVLPLSKVKKICKLDPDINLVTADAVKLITFCTERFIELLAKSCVSCAKEQGRKTVSNADFHRATRRSWLFYMLDEAIDEWPENGPPTKRSKSAASNPSNNDDGDEVVEDDAIVDEEVAVDDTDDVIEDDDEVIEIDAETVEAQRALSPIKESAMEEDAPTTAPEDEPNILVEEEEESSEESDIENHDDTINDDSFVKDIEDF
uniref:Transcription factor CBF/NF-Y/archaeal histone domain-containing protein n=1 Tax=Panagrolaimus sp. ES5 TaxID=591445 RepID=A0AC34FK81_9BILA